METSRTPKRCVSKVHRAASLRRRLNLLLLLSVSAALLISLTLLSPARAAVTGAAVTSVPAYPACAQVGSTATISGSGYGTSSGPIQVWIDQTQVGTSPSSIQVQPDGTWTASFSVPGTVDGQPITTQSTYPLYGIGNPDRASTSFCIVPKSSGAQVTVGRTYVANEKWVEAKQFSRGDLVRYQIVVSASAKAKINARMLVTGPQSRTIFNSSGDIEVSPSTGSVYFQSTIPSDAPLGTYTEKATVTFSGQSTVRTSTFSVTQANDPLINAVNWEIAHAHDKVYYKGKYYNWDKFCELAVEMAYGTSGKFTQASDDYTAQKNAGRLHANDPNAPRGALVFFNGDSSAMHVGLAAGDGKNYYTTDGGVIHLAPYSEGLGYLGWSYAPADWPGR